MNTPLPHLTTTATHPPPKKETEREGGGVKDLEEVHAVHTVQHLGNR